MTINAWNEGYFTDVGYTYGYYREINPVFQRFCLLVAGFAAPEPSAAAVHCELGFGQGVSVNIHAAANPGHYVATDFNPAHAAHANALAAAGGSGASLYDDSFEQLLDRPGVPQFDSISLHGIWTWVSRDNHALITEFARRHLKPGGVFYNSYNCFPGWSPAYPLRQLFALHDRFAAASHGVSQRVDAALGFAESLLAAKPRYLQAAPQLPERLKTIMEQNRHYIAHEYFNREWNCMYFTDVVDALAPAKLDYACTAVPLDNIDAVNLAADALAFLNTIDHPILREQARDYFVNQQFRKDLYVRGATRLSAVEQRQRLLDTRIVLLKTPDAIPLTVKGAIGEARLQAAIYEPVIAALAGSQFAPKSLNELSQALPEIGWAKLLQAIIVLVGADVAAPCQPEAAIKDVRKRCAALNQYLCDRSRLGSQVHTLASPVTGGGVSVNRIQQLFILLLAQGQKQESDWTAHVWKLLQSQGHKLVKEGKTLETEEANLAELASQAREFASQRLPILKALQVI